MNIVILGGDGYLGWPTSLHLSSLGHDVVVVDNFMRRRLVHEARSDSATPICTLPERVEAWEDLSGNRIHIETFDVCEYEPLAELVRWFAPDAIVNYGQIPSAPYSMISRRTAVGTQMNNVVGNLNVIFAIREFAPDCHLVKLGTMGEYGTPNIDIEEGFIKIHHNDRSDSLPFPKLPGSWYHASKVHDSHNIHLASRVYGLRATDLNQGVVYGVHTADTERDERLLTRFDYDEQFGTALNRFCVQAVLGHPLTIYGEGQQRRSFLNIRDTMRCVELAIANPPTAGEYRVFNQFTEVFSIVELAEEVQRAGAEVGLDIEIEEFDNPRVESARHHYNPAHTKLVDLGLKPTPLSDELVRSMLTTLERYRSRLSPRAIEPATKWR
jgi:UDP-sulfoquinovose synthase